MSDGSPARKEVFTTKWFQVLETAPVGGKAPHYVIRTADFVVIVAVTAPGQLLMVRQFRPAVNAVTLELPAGHIEPGETPEEAARKELLEETGYTADTFQLLACVSPSTARFTNRMWCFFAPDARPAPDAAAHREAGLDLVLYDRGLPALLDEPDFYSSPSCTGLFTAIARGVLKL
jgi:8-oxo-dGTP pyrophosphatase MutT (NUDIX family)